MCTSLSLFLWNAQGRVTCKQGGLVGAERQLELADLNKCAESKGSNTFLER